jgi:hypothetical protein
MSPYELSEYNKRAAEMANGSMDLTKTLYPGVTFAAGYDPDYLPKNGLDFEYFAQAGVFTEPAK